MLAAASLELKAEKQDAHSGTIMSVAFSPDGKSIVSGSDDETLKVWDPTLTLTHEVVTSKRAFPELFPVTAVGSASRDPFAKWRVGPENASSQSAYYIVAIGNLLGCNFVPPGRYYMAPELLNALATSSASVFHYVNDHHDPHFVCR